MEIIIGLLVLGCVATTAWLLLTLGVTIRCLRHPPRRAMARALASGEPLSPSEAGWHAESWCFRTGDGLEMPVWSIQGSGSGPVTVLVHGWGESRLDWLPLVEEWIADASSIVLPDLRGHGDTLGCCTFGRSEVADLTGLIESLDAGAVRVVGSGFGATLALRAAASIPGALSEVVAINPWNPDSRTMLHRLCDQGFPVRPPDRIFRFALRLVGVDSLRAVSIQEGPTIRLEVDQREDLQEMLERIGRDDVEINCVDRSST